MGDIVINKQGLIFLTLTSLILVLSVYYVTMPTELLLTTNSLYTDKDVSKDDKVSLETSNTISAMKNIHDDESSDEEKIKNDFEICVNQLDKAMHYYANYPYITTKNVNIEE